MYQRKFKNSWFYVPEAAYLWVKRVIVAMMDRLFGSSRFLVLAVIVTSFVAAVILYLVVLSIMFGIVSNLWGGIPSGVTQGKMLAVRLLRKS
ncbi:hypothetical protein ACT691_15255 [Vibrio metschnikovii]